MKIWPPSAGCRVVMGRSIFAAAGYEAGEHASGVVTGNLVVDLSRSPPAAAFGSFGEGVIGRERGPTFSPDLMPVTPMIGEIDSTLGCVVDLHTGGAACSQLVVIRVVGTIRVRSPIGNQPGRRSAGGALSPLPLAWRFPQLPLSR